MVDFRGFVAGLSKFFSPRRHRSGVFAVHEISDGLGLHRQSGHGQRTLELIPLGLGRGAAVSPERKPTCEVRIDLGSRHK